MLLRSLVLSNVRNLERLELEPGPGFNVLAGENGQGKTNVLEAIFAACTLRSFRTRRLAELIRFGEQSARLYAEVDREQSSRTYELVLTERSRKLRLDGKAIRASGDYVGGFHVVLFAPEDLAIPRGSPGERRSFLDRAVFQRTAAYLAEAQAYDKVLKSRNALLRKLRERGGDIRLLEVYDQQLAEHGARRMSRRARLLDEIEPDLAAGFAAISRSELQASLRYRPQLDPDSPADLHDEAALAGALREALAARRTLDVSRGQTTVGPHRDDLEFQLDGRSAAAYASQGQLRALILAWKIAEMDLLARSHGEPPILLLDDVSSELDPRRNEYLFEFLRSKHSQCFITTTHPRYVLAPDERVDFEVRSGVVTRRDSERM